MELPIQLIRNTDRCRFSACHSACSSSAHDRFISHWDFLPDAIVAKILALLPFSSIYLSRAVCQRWRTIIWSPMFISFCKLRPLCMPWLLEFQQYMLNQSWAYDLEGCQWFHLNFSFLPETSIILATAGGLVCLGRMAVDGYVIFVCNPLTKDWRKLPPISWQPYAVVMDVDHNTGDYNIIALVRRRRVGVELGFTASVLAFSRRRESWRETLLVPQDSCAGNLWDATVSDGVLYCLSKNHRIEAFDIEGGFWSRSSYPSDAMARLTRLQQLVEQQDTAVLENSYLCDRKGRLAMIAPFKKFKNVWVNKYDAVTRTWRSGHVSTLKGSVICTGRFSSLCALMPHQKSGVYFMHPKGNGHYSSASKSFQLLPRSPLSRQKLQRGEILLQGLWFEPRLDAVP